MSTSPKDCVIAKPTFPARMSKKKKVKKEKKVRVRKKEEFLLVSANKNIDIIIVTNVAPIRSKKKPKDCKVYSKVKVVDVCRS